MASKGLIRQYVASGAIGNRRVVKFGAADDVVMLATDTVTDLQIGFSVASLDVVDGERVDVQLTNIGEGIAGGVIVRGSDVCSDANGAIVACAPGAGTAARRIGIAQAAAVAGDIVEVLIAPGRVTTN